MVGHRQVAVLFVCLGNICRSPTAHGVFEQLVVEAGLGGRIRVDSAGTGDWHVGRAPDPRARQAAMARGVDIGQLRARQVSRQDFDVFDYILAMDRANLADLHAMKPSGFQGYLGLFLPFATGGDGDVEEVPDPYYGGLDGFEGVYNLVHGASVGLLRHLRRELGA